MSKESKRTQGKWIKQGNFIYMLDDDKGFNRYTFLVKACNGLHTQEEEKEMADHVFKAVNNHDGLVEALREVRDNLIYMHNTLNLGKNDKGNLSELKEDMRNELNRVTLALKEVDKD